MRDAIKFASEAVNIFFANYLGRYQIIAADN